MARRFVRPRLTDQQGNVLSGAWLRVLAAGTDTEVDVFAASAGGAALTQPRTTDARGEVECWLADGTGDVDLEWSDSGATYKGGTTKRVTFDTFSEFVDAPVSGGGSGLHADLTDLATSGHPAAAISGLGTAAVEDVSAFDAAGAAAAAQAASQPLDADLTAVAALTSPAVTITGAAQKASNLSDLTNAATARTNLGLGSAAVESAAAFDAAGAAAAAALASVPKALVDAAGDLLVGSAADTVARLPLGGAGEVLTVNAGATAPEWAAAAGGGGFGAAPITRTGTLAYPLGDIQLAGTFSLANDCAAYVPFEVAEGRAFDQIGLQMHWSGPQADTVVRLGIYANDDGDPGALVVDAGTVDTSTTGTKAITIAETLPPGLYWLCAAHQGVGTGTVVMVGAAGSLSPVPVPSAGYLGQNNGGWKDAAGPAGALPDPAVISSRDLYSVIPRLFLRGA